jgi:tetratricopeptide (TPR) repeat protein
MQQLEAQRPVAAEALFVMAFYNREKIPRYLLIQENSSSVPSTSPKCISNTPPNNHDLLSRDAAHFILDQAIGTLVAYSLLSVAYDTEPESYSIHRLVQMFTLHWLAKHRKTADMWAGKALRCLVREFPAKEYDDWNKSAELLPHVHNFVDLQPSLTPPPLFLENLLIACSRYLTMRAQYALATKYANLAIEMVEKKQGDLNITIMDARYCLARIYRNTAYFREAEDLLRVVIGNYSNVFGAADARTLSAAAVLSHVLRGQDKHTESEKVARESFQAFDDQDLVEGTELAESKNAVAGALATVLGDIGHYKESLQIQQGTVNRLLTHYTREHPRVVHVLHDMAVTLNMDGQYAASRELSREVFSLNQRFYGLDHPRTSNIEYNLGLVLEREMDNEAAEKHFRNVIDSRTKQSLGENDPETIDCIRSLAHCLEKQQRHRAAAEYYQQAMQRLLRNARPVVESTHTLTLKEDIARCLRALNESATETGKDESVTENPVPSLVASSSFGGGGGGGGGGDQCSQ